MSEPIRVLYNVSHHIPLGTVFALYFMFTGISAAAFLISTIGYVFGVEKFRPLARLAALIAPIFVLPAPLFLLADLEQPARFFHLFLMWNFRSPITWGTLILVSYSVTAVSYFWFVLNNKLAGSKVLGIAGICLAVGLELYTGFILAMGMGRPIWNSALMPIYFVVSGLVSGTAFLILMAVVKERFLGKNLKVRQYFPAIETKVIYDLGGLLFGLVLVDLIMTGSEILVLSNSRPAEQAAASLLLNGDFAGLFLGVQILLGLLVPLGLLAVPSIRRSNILVAAAAGLVLVGVFTMRYVTVLAAQMIPLN